MVAPACLAQKTPGGGDPAKVYQGVGMRGIARY
jgi:hypothetical protein